MRFTSRLCFHKKLFFFLPPDLLNEIFVEEMKERVRESQDLPPVYQTVVVRCQIASQFYEMAKEQTKICEQLVHDQHLQKQGWSAVIANLEDITLDITKRAEAFDKNYAEYLEEHETYKKLVERFVCKCRALHFQFCVCVFLVLMRI